MQKNRNKKLIIQVEKQRANKQFRCCCGSMHKIKDCVAIQTHWYTEPSGCTEGDYWNQGEINIICPETNHRNRMLFDNYVV